MGPSKGAAGSGLDHGTYETARVAMTHDGAAVVHVGTSSQGQGHATMLAGVAGRTLGLDPERVRVVAGDTDLTPYSPVSAVGSRGAAVVGGAVRAACAPLAAKLRRQAAHRLGCAVEDVALVDGEARGGGAAITVAALAHDVLMGQELGDGIEPGMDAIATVDPAATGMTYGAHGAVVEVDPALGVVRVLRYVALDDCGPRLEPAIVRGQLIGGIAQGLGAALLEEVRYDADARPLTTGLDAGGYLLPVAATMPALDLRVRETASPALPGGVKGVGEAGIAAPPAVVAQAVDAALGRVAAAVTRIPLTPERVLAGAAAPRPEVVAR
jgi:carbon-monoxide dehydrogenase large subunit